MQEVGVKTIKSEVFDTVVLELEKVDDWMQKTYQVCLYEADEDEAVGMEGCEYCEEEIEESIATYSGTLLFEDNDEKIAVRAYNNFKKYIIKNGYCRIMDDLAYPEDRGKFYGEEGEPFGSYKEYEKLLKDIALRGDL